MIWSFLAILHSIFRAANTGVGRLADGDIWTRVFVQTAVGFFLLLPFALITNWSHQPDFYLTAVGTSLIYSVGQIIHYNLVTARQGRILPLALPLEAGAGILLWALFWPPAMAYYIEQPFLTALIVLVFLFASSALFVLRPNDISRKTVAYIAVIGLTYAIAGIVIKLALMDGALLLTFFSFMLVFYVTKLVVMGALWLFKSRDFKRFGDFRLVKSSAFAGVLGVCGVGGFAAAVTLAPNPGYVSLVAMLLPVWLTLWHRARGIEDEASIRAALVLGTAVIGFMLIYIWQSSVS